MKEFYSLHNHTEYSNIRLIDCINKIPMLIDRAVKLGMKGIAITDHETVSGHIQAMKYVRDGKKKGKIPKDFKLILGNEVYLINGTADYIRENYKLGDGKLFYHYILLAKDEIGHEQLRRLSSNAWDKSFTIGKMTRVPTEKSDLERIVRENPGHLIASTACLGGELPTLIMQMEEVKSENELYEVKCKIDDFIRWNIDLFGDDFFLEMQPGASEEQKIVNEWLLKLSKTYGLNYIVTTDSHYLSNKSRMIHKAYLQSKEEEREVDSFYQTTYLMEIQEMYDYMKYFDEEIVTTAIENTTIIGKKIEEYSLSCSTIVPEAEVPEFEVENYFRKYYERFTVLKEYANSSNIYDKYLLYLIEKGYQKKEIHAKVRRNDFTEECKVERIAIELQEMALVTEKIKSSISSYYISTLELINIMWEEGDSLVGVARGSVTGMYTMYLIDLIQMNPLDWGLPHWRHISHEKAELSDLKKSAYTVMCMTKCGEPRNLGCAKALTVSVK